MHRLSLLVLVMVLVAAVPAAADSDDQLLRSSVGIAWSDPPETLSDAQLVIDPARPHAVIYRRIRDDLQLGDVPLDYIRFIYHDGQLAAVTIRPDAENKNTVRDRLDDYFSSFYGPSKRPGLLGRDREWSTEAVHVHVENPVVGPLMVRIRYSERWSKIEAVRRDLDNSDALNLLQQTLREVGKPIAYETLMRYHDHYEGAPVSYEGEIVQAMADDRWRVAINPRETIYVRYMGGGEPRLLEGDRIALLGIAQGRYSYTTVLGSRATVPEIHAYWVEQR